MTKKAEKAARVEANKIAAYLKKVRTLVGYVGPTVSTDMVVAAIAAKKAAEEYAFELASLEPVGKAVFPVKAESVAAANKWALDRVAKMTAKLEAANWNIDAVAPKPNYNDANYKVAAMRRADFSRITDVVSSPKWNDLKGTPTIVAIDPKGVARFVSNAEEEAAFQYDAFACKLVAKVGPCDSADLSGSHVWSSSILTIKKGNVVERWHTQQIENISVLGKYFPQWPTRLLKDGSK
jgi:hypothetical protein